MKTELLAADQPADVSRAAALLQQGELVAVPTETVYGLAANATDADAVAKIFQAKGRPADHPLIVHIPTLEMLEQFAVQIPQSAYQLAAAFWPGPLTLLLKKAPQVSTVVTGGLETIGIRMPAHPALLSLLQQARLAVAAPSANLYKKLSPTRAAQVLHGMAGKIAAVLDGGPCEHGLESTIVDLTASQPQILRSGPITAAQLEQVLGCTVSTPREHQVKVSGNVGAHYQPNTPVYLLPSDALLAQLASNTLPTAVLHFSALPLPAVSYRQQLPASAAAYGQQLYHQLFLADQQGVAQILVELPPHGPGWEAVQDRLRRAACHE
ncbi:yrdC/Sua5 family protein, required for threonylcarbamoyladenosine (t(6)A) formation in tRNA [Alishewanella aestuarii B11]|jgi:L-threonylcarbamoyladenylate synthase|uniref:Threonylcarbamoyl-AMP synthase n=1 Tax=Alishewanella aestuarii B11 TaxID=1197174 RepID=J2ID16_9ALTE|nr:L-threonylcarbamoyladenylate synthase [Alishewanella aestuarii]EJI85047.1 yrdC/Sua5 family protein, required for threonylcarbamoyladenosine (t(6)A) formation in tRNA [Alishewanella aestuarii B11]